MSTDVNRTAVSSGRLLPAVGIVTGVLWAVTSVAADAWVNIPDTLGDPARVQQAFLGHRPAAWVMVLGSIYLAVAVVFFAAGAQRVLAHSVYGAAALGGGVMVAVATVVHQGIGKFVLLAASNHHDQASLHTLGYLDAVTWPILGASSGAFLLATGIGSRRERMMPTWLSVSTIVLGVLALLGPGALVFWLVAPVWFVVVGFTLDRHGERRLREIAGAAPVASPLPD
jgi:hypothetical protein